MKEKQLIKKMSGFNGLSNEENKKILIETKKNLKKYDYFTAWCIASIMQNPIKKRGDLKCSRKD